MQQLQGLDPGQAYYGMWEKHRILYGGLVELIVNAMEDVKPGYIEWTWR